MCWLYCIPLNLDDPVVQLCALQSRCTASVGWFSDCSDDYSSAYMHAELLTIIANDRHQDTSNSTPTTVATMLIQQSLPPAADAYTRLASLLCCFPAADAIEFEQFAKAFAKPSQVRGHPMHSATYCPNCCYCC
jgi:hypothetical protein